MENVKISGIQLFLLIIGFLFGSTSILTPVASAKNDAWLAVIIGGLGGACLVWMYVAIAVLNPSKTLVEILRNRFGKYLGNAIAILYIWYIVHFSALTFRNFGEFIVTVTYPETPMVVIIGIFAALLVYAVNSGIEVVSRSSELFVPLLFVIIIIISLSLITTHDFTAFLPLLENGIKPVLHAAFEFATFPLGEIFVFLMVFPHFNKKINNLKKIAAFSVIIFILLYLWSIFEYLFVLGKDLLYRANFVPHIIASLIPNSNLEPLIDIYLIIGGGVKISICIYAAAKALSQVFGISDYRKLVTAVTTFSVVLSVWVYENLLEMVEFAQKVWPYYSIPFQIVIPLILLLSSYRAKTD
ncbi:MAG: spore germination protein [Thermosediminibacterales bacterium]|nr:spore germination protein [Thermosediminibacterales bacterium]